jgi:hypothetical protein
MTVELLNAAPHSDRLPDGSERRRSRRYPISTRGTLRPDEQPHGRVEVTVRNVSLHGLGFTASIPLVPGDTYRVDVGDGPLKFTGRARIVSCKLRRNGAYDLGAEFF